MDDNTPTKEDDQVVTKPADKQNIFLTPSASNICILCHRDITILFKNDVDGKRKRKLWNGPNKMTELCLLLESYLDIEISQTQDFQCICVYCAEKVKSGIKNKRAKREDILVGRELASAQFLRSRTYTKPKEPQSKKQLFSEEKQPEPCLKVEVDNVSYMIPEKYAELIKLLCHDNAGSIFCELQNIHKKSFNEFSVRLITEIIGEEVKRLCSTKTPSSFSINNVVDLEQVSYDDQYKELINKSPMLLSVISNIALRPDLDKRNKKKTSNSLEPAIVNFVGCLLFARNQKMNTNPMRNSLIFRRGKADKMCIERLNKLCLCLDHTSVLKKQSELARENFAPVLDLKRELDADIRKFENVFKKALYYQDLEIPIHNEESAMLVLSTTDVNESFFEEGALNPNVEIIDASSDDITSFSDTSTIVHSLSYLPSWKPRISNIENEKSVPTESDNNFSFCSKFVFVGDNLDIRTKRRHYQIGKANIDRHLYNLMVVKNRVNIPHHLIGLKSLKNMNIKDVPISYFIPTKSDEEIYREEMKMLMLQDLLKYVEELKWMKPYSIEHIPHEFTKETSEISNCFPLGILDKNETTTEGIIDIMREQHLFVPGNESEHPLRMLSFGDLVTVERQQNAQEDLCDHSSPSARLEGLVPALADFHTYGNFFEVIWHLLYNPNSSNDIGTLFQARNFLNTRSVPSSPMNDINACEDLLFKYSDALLITAFEQLKSKDGIDTSEPSTEIECKQKTDQILTSLVDKYVLPEVNHDINSEKSYHCPYCSKKYKKTKTLRKHIKNIHKGEKVATSDDGVLNYSVNALTLCFLAKNFNDARKHGDGERVSRLYKYFLLYFKLDSRHKYAYQSLHFLSQISFLLPPALSFELKWNRFVNTKGKIDSNVEIDRHLEHENKYVKRDLAQYQGKLTKFTD